MTDKERWMRQNGFTSEDIYIIGGGNTYNIKEELKKLGCRYSSLLGWYCGELIDVPAPYKLFHFAFDDLYKWEEKYGLAFPYPDIENKIKNIIYINKEKKTNASQFIGTQEERIFDLPIKYKRRKQVKDFYIYTFKNNDNILIWTTKKNISLEEEQNYLLTCTIAAHQEVNGIKMTKVNRCILNEL